MRDIRHSRQSPAFALGLVAFGMGLLGGGPARADRFPPDPVAELREALRTTPLDPTKFPDELTYRRETLTKRINALRTVSDLQRALMLNDWLDEDPAIRAVDNPIRAEVSKRLQDTLRAALESTNPTSQLAAANLIGELGVTIRGVGNKASVTEPLAPVLAKRVRDGALEVRVAAARALANINPPPGVAVPSLGELLRSEDVTLRRTAAGALGSLVQRVAQLIPLRAGKTTMVVEASPEDVVAMAAAVVPVLTPGLQDADREVRRLSTQAVQNAAVAESELALDPRRSPQRPLPTGKKLSPEERQDVQETYENYQNNQRLLAPLSRALGDHAPDLRGVLDDSDPAIRLLARRTLEEMAYSWLKQEQGRGNLPALPGGAPPVRGQVPGGEPERGGNRGPRPLPREPLPRPQPEKPEANASPTRPLLQGLQTVLPELQGGIRDPNWRVRLATVEALEMLGNEAAPAAPTLVAGVDDPNLFVRWASARVLGKIDPPVAIDTAVPALTRLLFDPHLDVQQIAAQALQRYGPDARAAVPALVRRLGEGDAEIRVAALRTLEAIGTDARDAVPAIGAALSQPSPRVRQAAAEVMGRFGPLARSQEAALRRALEDSDPNVRKAASDALFSVLPSALESER
jgi:HEAT repeat protein